MWKLTFVIQRSVNCHRRLHSLGLVHNDPLPETQCNTKYHRSPLKLTTITPSSCSSIPFSLFFHWDCPWNPSLLYLYLFLCPWPPVPISDRYDTYDQATRRANTALSGLKKVDPRRGVSSGRQQAEEAEAGNRESVHSSWVVSSAEREDPFFGFLLA